MFHRIGHVASCQSGLPDMVVALNSPIIASLGAPNLRFGMKLSNAHLNVTYSRIIEFSLATIVVVTCRTRLRTAWL
jgi:hypothetical protein